MTMKFIFTGRHFEITKAIKEFTLEKLKAHLKFMDDIIDVHVILAVEKYRHIAEITVRGKKVKFSGKQETLDMYSSITAVLEKIEKQAKKRKEKFTARKKKRMGAECEDVSVHPHDESARDDEAVPNIVMAQRQEAKPMTVEEAVLQMENSRKELLVFKNFRSRKVNVLYRRRNGDLTLIETES